LNTLSRRDSEAGNPIIEVEIIKKNLIGSFKISVSRWRLTYSRTMNDNVNPSAGFIIQVEDEAALLSNTNKLLTAVGISAKRITSTEELSRVASSLFVAVYESLFHEKIIGVIRAPKSVDDYENNAQLVIDSLSDQIQLDLKHISGKSIVTRDIRVLSNLVHILLRIVSLTG
jgi:hypothetical protein